jgi:hypothetical protein
VIHWLIVCCILVIVSESVTKIVLNITLCIQINLKVQEQLQAAYVEINTLYFYIEGVGFARAHV